jgi:hypothetical protein
MKQILITMLFATVIFAQDVYLGEEHEKRFKDGVPASKLPSKMPRESRLRMHTKEPGPVTGWSGDTFHNLYKPGVWWSREKKCWSFFHDLPAFIDHETDKGVIDSVTFAVFLPFTIVYRGAGYIYCKYVWDYSVIQNRLQFIESFDTFCRWAVIIMLPFLIALYYYPGKLYLWMTEDVTESRGLYWLLGFAAAFIIQVFISGYVLAYTGLSSTVDWIMIIMLTFPLTNGVRCIFSYRS